MTKASRINKYEDFRSAMVGAINSLDLEESERQVFLISLQQFYMQMLMQIPNDSVVINGELVKPEIIN
jgi:hypothetical protein